MRFFSIFLTLIFFATNAFAVDPKTRLDAFAKDLRGLEGRFVQRVFTAEGKLDEETRGSVALSAPRLFRWEYEQPFPQLIVADGDSVWVYDPDLEQVTVRPQSYEEQQSPLAALIDRDELERQFKVSDGGESDGMAWVILKPRSDEADFQSARLGFSGDDLRRMVLNDALGQRTEIEFSSWRRNPEFAADTFKFRPPPGVDVVGEAPRSAEVFPIGD